ncbi:MAG: NAD-dependent deacetylase [Blastocatellia bacterium]|jgi:NAD-dependent deacetylase|nr:NAD-dependent deacetylase [Blastocatellia bacterium]
MQTARNVLVLTGAGISAESGVPTFRGGGNTTIWKGMPFDVISSARMLQTNLPAVWEWFNYRRRLLAALKPNAGHLALATWHDRFDDFTLVTQNVDNLHQLGGSRDVIELHGNIWRARCVACSARYNLCENEFGGESKQPEVDEGKEDPPPAPLCEACGNSLRPDVVLFGELLPPGAFERAAVKAQQCDLCLVVGTSALVYPAASLPEIAADAGAYVVEVNPERTPLSELCDEVVMGKAGEILPLL